MIFEIFRLFFAFVVLVSVAVVFATFDVHFADDDENDDDGSRRNAEGGDDDENENGEEPATDETKTANVKIKTSTGLIYTADIVENAVAGSVSRENITF